MVAKLFSYQVPGRAEAERAVDMPVQFLPSTMLSWRAPGMTREGTTMTAAPKARKATEGARRDSQPPAP